MKVRSKNLKSMLLVLILVISAVTASFTVSFALDDSYFTDYCGDIWAYPGKTAYMWTYTSGNVSSVRIEYKNGSVWQNYATCKHDSELEEEWYVNMQVSIGSEGKHWTFRFVADTPEGEIYSYPFTVYSTSTLTWERIQGANRFETARLAAEYIGKTTSVDGKYQNAIIACGTDFADALGGTYLAAEYGAPILLVNKTGEVMRDTADHIKKNMASDGTVFILGGTGAVSADMEQILHSAGISSSRIRRFAGSNRYDTNLQILKFCGVTNEEIMVCCGTNFADALSASAVGNPILLVGKGLTDDQKAYMKTLEPEWVNMVGGTAAVPQSIEDWFTQNEYRVWRYAGANRYETSVMLANSYFYHQSYYVVMAYGRNFPDGLAGGALAYALGAPLILVDNNNWGDAEGYVWMNDCRSGLAMGGPALISDETVERIMKRSDVDDMTSDTAGADVDACPEPV